MNKGAIISSLISIYLHTIIRHSRTMRTFQMAEEQYRAQDMGRITSKGINQQGESINEYQGQKRAQSFEEQMLQFMGDNKKLINLHE